MFKTMEERSQPTPTTVKPTFAGFIEWLKTKDPKETYVWLDYGNCAVAQYHASLGQKWVSWDDDEPYAMNKLAQMCGSFGTLLKAAEAYYAKLPH